MNNKNFLKLKFKWIDKSIENPVGLTIISPYFNYSE
jgi:hypothetical protein